MWHMMMLSIEVTYCDMVYIHYLPCIGKALATIQNVGLKEIKIHLNETKDKKCVYFPSHLTDNNYAMVILIHVLLNPHVRDGN